jgi:hypothetical protein
VKANADGDPAADGIEKFLKQLVAAGRRVSSPQDEEALFKE